MMERKIFLWIVFILLSSTSRTESMFSECKRPWVSIGTGCYNFDNLFKSIKRYSDAVRLCPPHSHPVDIGNEEELRILSLAVRARLLSRIPLNGIWTCGSRTSNMQDYYWEIRALEKEKVGYFAWLDKETSLQNRSNSLALAFDGTTNLFGYMDVNSDYPTGLGLVCKGNFCPPPICLNDMKCVSLIDPNGCTTCSNCEGKGCNVQVDIEADGSTVCTTCYCKKECDDVEKCQHGCHLVLNDYGCPRCECPAVIIPLDVQLTFNRIVPKAGDMICRTVNKLVGVSEICTKRVVVRCQPTSNFHDKYGGGTVGIVTLSIRTSYINFISILHDCKYFLENNLMNKVGSYSVQNILIEVPNHMPTPPPLTQSTCLKPKRRLPCDDTNKFYELRWEFNTRLGSCRPYVHNGCQDDRENSFKTLLECRVRCSKARCFLPRNPGSCEVPNERWAYNPYTGACELFGASEDGGNSNSFRMEEECELSCRGVVCDEPADVGPCSSRSVETRYHYDVATNKCNVLKWGGCFGNGNNFESYISCEENCYPDVSMDLYKDMIPGNAETMTPGNMKTPPGNADITTPENAETMTPRNAKIRRPVKAKRKSPGNANPRPWNAKTPRWNAKTPPGNAETMTPGNAKTPSGNAETMTPGNAETMTPRNAETMTPGNAETMTPGYAETMTPGNAETMTPGNAETMTPGYAETTPGYAEMTPRNAQTTPGNAETTPGYAETTPGNAQKTPGNMETTPGNAQTMTPGNAQTTPGNAETTTPGNSTSEVKTTADLKSLSTMHYTNGESPCICTVDGDPRVITFDGSPLLIDGPGIYLLVETDRSERGHRFVLAVETGQAAPDEFPGLLSIVRIYFKVEGQLMVVENNSVQIDGRPVTVLPYTVGDVTVSGVINDHVRIFSHSTGYYVTTRFGQTAQDAHVLCSAPDIVLHSSDGMCGNCNGDTADEFVVDSNDLFKDPDRYQKISKAYNRFILMD